MTSLSKIKVYATHPHSCSYLENKEATTLFVDPNISVTSLLYSELADQGFRRSGEHIYRPHCEKCAACVPARVPVNDFTRKRRFRRIWNRNQDLTVEKIDDIQTDQYYKLYARYISEKHTDGDMYPPNREQYDAFLTNQWGLTDFYCFKLEGQPIAVAVTDKMEQGLSAIYTFYDPSYKQRSLGVYAILWQIALTQTLEQPYLYLGYWIKDSQKMNYKIDYRPLQLLLNGQWLTLN